MSSVISFRAYEILREARASRAALVDRIGATERRLAASPCARERQDLITEIHRRSASLIWADARLTKLENKSK